MGAEPPPRRAVPDPRDHDRRRAGLQEARPARRPEVLGAVDDRDGHLAGRDRAADAGRGAQPDGEEVRAARPLRQGQDLRAAGLRWNADLGQGRHLARRSARGVVSGAQEVQRHQARAAARRDRADLQRRVRRRDRAAVCGQGRRRQPVGAFRHRRGHQAPAAQGADGQEGRHLRQAGQEGVCRVLQRAPRRARDHAAADRGKPAQPERHRGERAGRHRHRPRDGAGDRPVHEPGGHPQRSDLRRRPRHQARRLHHHHARHRGSADLHDPPQRAAGADARRRDDRRRQHRRARQGARDRGRQRSSPSFPTASSSSASPTSRRSSANRSGNSSAR